MEVEFKYYLEVISTENKGKHIQIGDAEKLIGRQLLSFDPSISREHFLISGNKAAFTIKDLGSSNNTLINGIAIKSNSEADVAVGDVIRVGKTRLKLVMIEQKEQKNDSSFNEMPYEEEVQKQNIGISEPDKRGLDLNLGSANSMGTKFAEAIDKFRKLSLSLIHI